MAIKAKVTGGSLNLRESTSTSAAVLLILPDGMELVVKTPGDNWSRVIVDGPDGEATEGYVMTRYLKMQPDPEPEAAAKPKKKATKKSKE